MSGLAEIANPKMSVTSGLSTAMCVRLLEQFRELATGRRWVADLAEARSVRVVIETEVAGVVEPHPAHAHAHRPRDGARVEQRDLVRVRLPRHLDANGHAAEVVVPKGAVKNER